MPNSSIPWQVFSSNISVEGALDIVTAGKGCNKPSNKTHPTEVRRTLAHGVPPVTSDKWKKRAASRKAMLFAEKMIICRRPGVAAHKKTAMQTSGGRSPGTKVVAPSVALVPRCAS